MSPMILIGVGWLLATLGFGGFLGPLGGPATIAGYGAMAYGLHQIRWRSDWFGRAFWLAVVALVLVGLIVADLILNRAQVYTVVLTQGAIAFSVARGVQACLATSEPPTGKQRALTITGMLVAASLVAIVLLDTVLAAGADLPATPLALVVFVSGLATIVFGVLVLTLNREPALQAEG